MLPALVILLVMQVCAERAAGVRGQATLPWLAGDYVDYSPSGMPDFSQCRGAWSRPGAPPQWTHAGPVALADLLWWLDSRAESDPIPPDTHSDHHALVTAYPVFGPQPDDHAEANLGPLVEDLALRVKTNGVGQAGTAPKTRGTRWEALTAGVQDYLTSRRVDDDYRLELRKSPSSSWLETQVARDAGVLLYLAVWERQDEGWRWVGGHYAAVAGADATRVGLADPLADRAADTGQGRAVPEDPAAHGCRSAPAAHDDAARISHDLYLLHEEPELPLAQLVLEGYFDASNWGEAAAFRDQNSAAFLEAHASPWEGGAVLMSVAAALSLTPLLPPGSGPDPSATLSPTPSPTPGSSPDPSATATLPAPTASPGTGPPPASPSPTQAPSTTPTEPTGWPLLHLPIVRSRP